MRFSVPALVMETINLATRYGLKRAEAEANQRQEIVDRLKTIYMFINQTIFSMTSPDFETDSPDSPIAVEGLGQGLLAPADMALRLYSFAAQNADMNGLEEVAYEFFVQVFLTLHFNQ